MNDDMGFYLEPVNCQALRLGSNLVIANEHFSKNCTHHRLREHGWLTAVNGHPAQGSKRVRSVPVHFEGHSHCLRAQGGLKQSLSHDKLYDLIQPLPGFEIGKNKGSLAAHFFCVALHDLQ